MRLQFILVFLIILVVGTFLPSAIASAVHAATIVPLEYKFVVFSSTATRTTVLNVLNAEGRNGWEVAHPAACDTLSCTSVRLLLKRRK